MLSLFEVEVTISLLTNGGQSVTQYAVSWCSWQLCKRVSWPEWNVGGIQEVKNTDTHASSQQTCMLLSLQVKVRGTNYTFPSSEQMQVSLLLNQLSVNLTKGERVTLRAFAVNSVGTSGPVSVGVIVPCELWVYGATCALCNSPPFVVHPHLCSPSQHHCSSL